jgi:hypothetical protein
MLTTSQPETLITSVRDQIDALVASQAPNGHALAQASLPTQWMSSVRWTIRAEVSRTRRCAEAPTRRTGTTRVGSEDGRTTSGEAGHSTSREASGGHGGVTASTTTGETGSRTTGSSHTGSSSVEARGPVDMFEEQWDYSVQWEVTIEHDPESLNPMTFLPRIIAAVSDYGGPWSESGTTDIGSISIMNMDATPPAAHGGGGGGGGRRSPRHPPHPPGPTRGTEGTTTTPTPSSPTPTSPTSDGHCR